MWTTPRKDSTGGTLNHNSEGLKRYQVEGDGAAEQEARVDVDGVVLVLNDPGQATDDGADGVGEDQQGLEQLGRVCQGAVEVHLRTHNTSGHDCHSLYVHGGTQSRSCAATAGRTRDAECGGTHRDINSSKGRKSSVLGREGLSARDTRERRPP